MHGKEEEAEAETVPRLEEAQLQLGISETYHPRTTRLHLLKKWPLVMLLTEEINTQRSGRAKPGSSSRALELIFLYLGCNMERRVRTCLLVKINGRLLLSRRKNASHLSWVASCPGLELYSGNPIPDCRVLRRCS
ncbi:hypothetical protein VPH35_033498 [Triticum aestivum]